MNEERIEKIETKIAFQEDLIEELNKTIYQQQRELDRLKANCESLTSHIATLYESLYEGRSSVNEKPPHY